jgi:septal ring factor EnvC (AmiA/AmiB activator)
MKRKLTLGTVLGTATILMGMNMPSCPGQQAMQKQLDDLTTKVGMVEKNSSGGTAKVAGLEKEVADLKSSLGEVAEVLKTHKTTIEQLQAQLQEMSMKSAAGKKGPAPKKRH